MELKPSAWWGAPKKFSTHFEERKISWLELFYDLVYVIAIAKITHNLSEHFSFSNLITYFYFFGMIFWGWLNGSQYHDLHGSSGFRTQLITLWQMLIVAALVITLGSPPEKIIFYVTIALLIMQLFITYLWWSVGLYDKEHRKLNKPYTVLYLISFGVLFSTLFLDPTKLRIVFFAALVINYLPPFLTSTILKRTNHSMNLSESMTERLGLFTIIMFGEVISGVISGISARQDLKFEVWIDFALAVIIVFALWWLFFTMLSDRKSKPGLVKSSFLQLSYVPTLAALGLLSLAFNGLFENPNPKSESFVSMEYVFGFSLCFFLFGIILISAFIEYPSYYSIIKRRVEGIFWVGIAVLMALTILHFKMSVTIYLLIVLCVILCIVSLLNYIWYSRHPSGEVDKNAVEN